MTAASELRGAPNWDPERQLKHRQGNRREKATAVQFAAAQRREESGILRAATGVVWCCCCRPCAVVAVEALESWKTR